MKLKIQYNSPVVLTYTLICVAVTFFDWMIYGDFAKSANFPNTVTGQFFTLYPNKMSFDSVLSYFRVFSHSMGHGGWNHLLGNFSFILLIGPILEERYKSGPLLVMILLTATITGILQTIFFRSGLLGASGVVFMMILLVSFTNFKSGSIPLTFILIAILYLGKELFNAVNPSPGTQNISQFAHIIGGLCGGLFGYVINQKNMLKDKPET
ncbi:rhomboid family intramembrane serine protease [Microscilla marina]|uniref:Rhomboid (Drosophila) related protein 1, putative n=1 Tax=Microscilla marina ATCC 23134 TaxID=313606 RepID=A1ZXF2_MICM2|nr:rhomboid family intramembrane serine protease [Microscilla marina]EAY24920.1 rhomboid (drosophila) related protein 1, putative [Microscilla marina ATCC 23134]